jgi:hypothetical protein
MDTQERVGTAGGTYTPVLVGRTPMLRIHNSVSLGGLVLRSR